MELNHAVVEYIAPTEYMVRPPQPLVYMFVIDVSYPAIQCGMVATAAATILESLDRIPDDEGRTKVGVMTVDSSIQFYNLKVGESECSRIILQENKLTVQSGIHEPSVLLLGYFWRASNVSYIRSRGALPTAAAGFALQPLRVPPSVRTIA